jgi:solute carrier family 25 phosphate transporter 3
MSLFPRQETLQHTFVGAALFQRAQDKPSPYQARPELYGAYSIVDDAKSKAHKLSAEATAELDRASQKAQAKVGGIEMYSGKYYATCTFGGLMACVSSPLL